MRTSASQSYPRPIDSLRMRCGAAIDHVVVDLIRPRDLPRGQGLPASRLIELLRRGVMYLRRKRAGELAWRAWRIVVGSETWTLETSTSSYPPDEPRQPARRKWMR
jgi:hypothetical protein